jgi:hypothetical protein
MSSCGLGKTPEWADGEALYESGLCDHLSRVIAPMMCGCSAARNRDACEEGPLGLAWTACWDQGGLAFWTNKQTAYRVPNDVAIWRAGA